MKKVFISEDILMGWHYSSHKQVIREELVRNGFDLHRRYWVENDFMRRGFVAYQPFDHREILFRSFKDVKFKTRQNPLLFRRFTI